MKWKTLFNSYKAVNYTISSVTGNNYHFGYIMIFQQHLEGHLIPTTRYQFCKKSLTQKEVNSEITDFLKNLEEGFWLDIGTFCEKYAKWEETLRYRVMSEEIEEDIYYPEYEVTFYDMNLTQILGLYHELDSLKMLDHLMRDSFKIAIYQYLWSTNVLLRKKLLNVLSDIPFNLTYRDMERSFITITNDNWKNTEMLKGK